jgi:hypothetical protein
MGALELRIVWERELDIPDDWLVSWWGIMTLGSKSGRTLILLDQVCLSVSLECGKGSRPQTRYDPVSDPTYYRLGVFRSLPTPLHADIGILPLGILAGNYPGI